MNAEASSLRALGVDIGGTASRWTLLEATGELVSRGQTEGATGHIFHAAGRERMAGVLNHVAAQTGPVHAVVLGVTGLGATVYDEMVKLILAAFPDVGPRIRMMHDIGLAYHGAFAPGEGHLISAGTGSAGVHVPREGEPVIIGGKGILIDDGGSGAWIALRALRELFRRMDETGGVAGMELLAEPLFAAMGGNDWTAARAFVYGGDRGQIGQLAVPVGASARAGDETALAILKDAGHELSRMAQVLRSRVGLLPAGFIGGVLALHPIVRQTIETDLAGTEIRFPKADAALAAARLALAL